MDLRNRFHGIDSASLCSLAGRYDNPIPTWLLAPIDCSKIPALIEESVGRKVWRTLERALDIPRKEPWISLGMGHRYPSERALDIPRKGHRISSERAWISLRKDPGYPRKGLWDIPRNGPSTYYFSMPVTPLS